MTSLEIAKNFRLSSEVFPAITFRNIFFLIHFFRSETAISNRAPLVLSEIMATEMVEISNGYGGWRWWRLVMATVDGDGGD